MDQPGHEIIRLEKILDAFAKWEALQDKRRQARQKNRQKHTPQVSKFEGVN